MIDLHSHILPGIDDGAKTPEIAIEMARIAAADGITVMACTPHILPGVYNNSGPAIRAAAGRLQQEIAKSGIPLALTTGADVHVTPDLVAQLRSGHALTLNDTRYFLLEPPHHVPPPRLEDHVFGLLAAGYVPILTHPERLSWIEAYYQLVKRLAYNGILVQLTAGSLLGRFGRRPRYWAERMLDDGLCHVLASDAHNTDQRAPRMAEARDMAARKLGEVEATNLVLNRPLGILKDVPPSQLPSLPEAPAPAETPSAWSNLLQRVRRAGRA